MGRNHMINLDEKDLDCKVSFKLETTRLARVEGLAKGFSSQIL